MHLSRGWSQPCWAVTRRDELIGSARLLKTDPMSGLYESRFVADGCERARAAAEPQIRADVERQYASRIAAASLIHRWRLKREMNKQIAKLVAQVAPPDALF